MVYQSHKTWENPFSSYHSTGYTHEDHEPINEAYANAEKYANNPSDVYQTDKGKEEKDEEKEEESLETELKKEKESEEGDEIKTVAQEIFSSSKPETKRKSNSIDEAIEKAISSEKEVIHK